MGQLRDNQIHVSEFRPRRYIVQQHAELIVYSFVGLYALAIIFTAPSPQTNLDRGQIKFQALISDHESHANNLQPMFTSEIKPFSPEFMELTSFGDEPDT